MCLGVLTGLGKGRSWAGLPYVSGLALFLCVSTYVQDFQPKDILKLFRAVPGANSDFWKPECNLLICFSEKIHITSTVKGKAWSWN